MVVGGYNSDVPNGLLDDVEVISPRQGNVCTKRVSPTGPAERCFNIDGNVECEASSLGLTGITSKDNIMVCGGKNGDANRNACLTYDYARNTWRSTAPMLEQRFRPSATLDEQGNMWVLGGSNDTRGSDSTEIFDFRRKRWRKGRPLPGEYRDSGLDSHCTVGYGHITVLE